jgi:hypothetical protein
MRDQDFTAQMIRPNPARHPAVFIRDSGAPFGGGRDSLPPSAFPRPPKPRCRRLIVSVSRLGLLVTHRKQMIGILSNRQSGRGMCNITFASLQKFSNLLKLQTLHAFQAGKVDSEGESSRNTDVRSLPRLSEGLGFIPAVKRTGRTPHLLRSLTRAMSSLRRRGEIIAPLEISASGGLWNSAPRSEEKTRGEEKAPARRSLLAEAANRYRPQLKILQTIENKGEKNF